ncbi:MAG TPA: ABC transporter permease [Vicinamibacterales bacterium]|nr:ABC transporter permease [Vicinamibacterales bacterium]HPK70761.1 ABC transporter permease [Vicinamibacterales bacterium]
MRRLLHVFTNDVRRHLRAPLVIVVFMAIPLAMTALIGAVFGPKPGANALPRIAVLVVDRDKSVASKLLLGAFDSARMKEMFEVTVIGESEGRERMKAGRASAMIVVPERFTLDLMEWKPVALTVVKNPAEQFLPDVAEEAVNTLAVVLSGAVRAFGDEVRGIRTMMDLPLEAFPWASLGPELAKAQSKVIAASKYLDPLLIRLKSEEVTTAGSRPAVTRADVFSAVLPGMAIMFLLFIVQTVMRDILAEREDGTLRRMMSAPLRPLELVGARILGGWLMGLAVLLVMAAAGRLLFGATWGPFGYFLLLGATAAFWVAAFFALFHALVANRNQAGAIGAPVILVFSLFGGSMMSPDAMPAAFRPIGLFTPNRWFIDGAALVRDGRFPLAAVAVLGASGLALLALAVPALLRQTRSAS